MNTFLLFYFNSIFNKLISLKLKKITVHGNVGQIFNKNLKIIFSISNLIKIRNNFFFNLIENKK